MAAAERCCASHPKKAGATPLSSLDRITQPIFGEADDVLEPQSGCIRGKRGRRRARRAGRISGFVVVVAAHLRNHSRLRRSRVSPSRLLGPSLRSLGASSDDSLCHRRGKAGSIEVLVSLPKRKKQICFSWILRDEQRRRERAAATQLSSSSKPFLRHLCHSQPIAKPRLQTIASECK